MTSSPVNVIKKINDNLTELITTGRKFPKDKSVRNINIILCF